MRHFFKICAIVDFIRIDFFICTPKRF